MQNSLPNNFLGKVLDDAFPCVMAQTALATGNIHFIACRSMIGNSIREIKVVLSDIYAAIRSLRNSVNGYHSIVVQFDTAIECEHQFELYMWDFLQHLHEIDRMKYSWDDRVSSDPHSAAFSFSLMNEAFYIIGMHPKSSRKARVNEKPILVFNLHSQFERLREKGAYENLKDKVRSRDISYSGSKNPMLDDFGASSEATQYSGRQFDKKTWKCPFQPCT